MHVNRFSPCVSRCRRDQRTWLGELWDMRSQPSSLAAALEKRQRYRRDAFINRVNTQSSRRSLSGLNGTRFVPRRFSAVWESPVGDPPVNTVLLEKRSPFRTHTQQRKVGNKPSIIIFVTPGRVSSPPRITGSSARAVKRWSFFKICR